jgi:L-amino acid N-acyltransferase YncA
MSMAIADADRSHMVALQSIYAHWVIHGLASFEEAPPDLAEMERRRLGVQEQGLPYIVALDGAVIMGFAYAGPYRLRPAYRFTVEDSVYVAPEATGRGVGRALLAQVILRAESRGLRQMVAVIGDSANGGSIGLHESQGFRRVGVLQSVGFKHGRWVDSVLMQRPLGLGDETLPQESKLLRRGAA